MSRGSKGDSVCPYLPCRRSVGLWNFLVDAFLEWIDWMILMMMLWWKTVTGMRVLVRLPMPEEGWRELSRGRLYGIA